MASFFILAGYKIAIVPSETDFSRGWERLRACVTSAYRFLRSWARFGGLRYLRQSFSSISGTIREVALPSYTIFVEFEHNSTH